MATKLVLVFDWFSFPDAWKNIQQALKDEHMKGYLEAKEEEN